MKLRVWIFLAAFTAASLLTHGQQSVSISSADMFNQVGQYYLAYANDTATNFSCSHLMGTLGTGQFWDFSSGPTHQTFRYDDLAPGPLPGPSSFTNATIEEQKSVSGTGSGIHQKKW